MMTRGKVTAIVHIAFLVLILTACNPVKNASSAPSKSATTASAADVQQVFIEDCARGFNQRPNYITLACADAGMNLIDIKWSTWGSQRADGTGHFSINNCDPNCAEGKFSKIPVAFVLRGVVPDTGNRFVFSKLTVNASGEGFLFANKKSDTFELASATPESIISERDKKVRISTPVARSDAKAIADSAKVIATSYTSAATAWAATASAAQVAAYDSRASSGNGVNVYKTDFYSAADKAVAYNKIIAPELAKANSSLAIFFETPEGKAYADTVDYKISYAAMDISLKVATANSTQALVARSAYISAHDDYVSNFVDPYNMYAIAGAFFDAAARFASASKATAVAFANYYDLMTQFWSALSSEQSSGESSK